MNRSVFAGRFSRRGTLAWLLATLLLLAGWIALAPAEQTLGDGIRFVYLHVATTWAGLAAIYLGAVLSLLPWIRNDARIEEWTLTTRRVGLALFAGGFLLSLLAASMTWGGVLWQEPRIIASGRVVALGVLAYFAARWLGKRVGGIVWLLFAIYTGWSLQATALVFHPRRPIQASTPLGIKAAFLGSFLLVVTAAALAVRLAHRSGSDDPPRS